MTLPLKRPPITIENTYNPRIMWAVIIAYVVFMTVACFAIFGPNKTSEVKPVYMECLPKGEAYTCKRLP